MLPNELRDYIHKYSNLDLIESYKDYLKIFSNEHSDLDLVFMEEFQERELLYKMFQIRGDILESNSEGSIAVAHWNSNGSIEEIDDTVYSWVPKFGVSLAWIKPEHVDRILKKKVRACCNVDRNKYNIATPNQVKVWGTGHY